MGVYSRSRRVNDVFSLRHVAKLILLLVLLQTSSLCLARHAFHWTHSQQAYLATIDSIKLCTDPDWLPYEGIDEEGRFVGIMSDFYQLWSKNIGKPIELVKTTSWQQSLQYVEQGQCDLLSSAQKTAGREHFLNFSQVFISYPLAVATQPKKGFILNLGQVSNETFVMVKGYAAVDLIKQQYPNLKIRLVTDAKEGLEQVETGRAFAYIDTVPTISYQMLKHGISFVEISGVLEQKYDMSIGVREDLPELLSIMNKVLSFTTETQKQTVLNKWVSVKMEYALDYSLMLKMFAVMIVVLLLFSYHIFIVTKHNKALKKINKQLEHMSQSDQLTGVANRYFLHRVFETESKRAERYQHDFSIIILDIDLFKRVNDEKGHNTGDSVIQTVASLLKNHIRDTDSVGRWGGEEFLILCPETDLHGAYALAEDLRELIETTDFEIGMPLTASFGVAQYQHAGNMSDCIKQADTALYKAKQSGRNCVMTTKDS